MSDSNNLVLSAKNLSVSYDSIQAVKGISFEVREGEIVSLIGANGAGKTSILRAVSGMLPFQGDIVFRGNPLRHATPDRIVAQGMAHVPEGRRIFGNLTVLENLRLATWQRKERSALSADFKKVFQLFPRLEERRSQMAGTLSGGEQQMLAVGRALMSKASMMLLDEPSMGLAPVLVVEIFKVLKEINQQGLSLLLVEQNAHMALQIASRGYVLETGSIVLEGTGRELLENKKVREAYLGA